ncbi:hypothetical protein BDW22DRAFT_1321109 [Trametopsis cervina]|nr:hypothetical protein BDW22DRAFT_1321109 [Trametopsis cervina]
MDLDAELDFVAGPTDSDSKRKQDKTVDMDVEDELLSLLDDKPHHHRGSSHFHTRPDVPKLSTPLPSAPHSPEQASLQPSPTKVKHASNGVVMSERESMPPPQTPDPALDSSSKKGEASATASTKKKDGAAKKPAAAAKPKAPKASTVAKSNGKGSALAKDGSSTPVLSASNSALTVPAVGTESKVKKTSPHPAGTVTGAGVAAKRAVSTSVGGAASRSRSTSVMPTPHDADKATDKKVANEEPEEEAVVDDKLYCICKTKYDEDRVMIACDRCDEWYHTQCVNMPDLEVDLVDQFICPVCIANNPHLPLKTTYKRRCHTGLNHPHPSSPSACHKPARGAFSKYCSDDCAVRFMQSKIRRWGGDKAGLWEGVKDADRREAVVVRCVTDGQEEIDGGDTKPDINTPAKLSNGDASATRTEVVKPSKSKTQREADRLDSLLSRLPVRRSALKKEEELLLWRESVVDLAIARAEAVGECGWDQRLCFGEDEIAEFGAEVLQSYDSFKDGGDGDSMHVDGGDEWWCRGKKKCDRHAGWQKLRQMEAEVDRELLNASLDKITTEERELRSRIEDILKDSDSKPPSDHQSAQPGPGTTPLKPINGDGEVNGVNGVKTKTNGAGADSGAKKGKKKKAEGP